MWRHALAALLVLGGAAAGGIGLALSGDPSEAWPVTDIPVPPPALPAVADNLMSGEEGALPDLLDEVAPGDNPTAALVTPPPPPTLAPRSKALTPVQASLLRDVESGPIPTRAPGGQTAYTTYARPFEGTAAPDFAIVLGGLGIDGALTERAIETLPAEVTLSFAAHAPGLQLWMDRAREDGHEVVLELPMESADFDPGEPGAGRALRVDSDTNTELLEYHLSRAQGYFAVSPFGGDAFLGSAASDAVLRFLSSAGLGLLTDGQSTADGLSGRAERANLPFRDGSFILDPRPDAEIVSQNLQRLEAQAVAGNRPIGFGFAYPVTVEAIADFLSSVERAEPAPASALMP